MILMVAHMPLGHGGLRAVILIAVVVALAAAFVFRKDHVGP